MRNETDNIPDIFLDVLTPASHIHNHNTRFVSNVNSFRPRVSTNLGKTSFKFSAPKIWKTVPSGFKCLPYHKFKKEWKSYLLTNQIWPWLYVIWDFISSLYCCWLSEHDGVQQESSCYFGHFEDKQKVNLCTSFHSRSMFHFENTEIWTSEFSQCVTPKQECCLVEKVIPLDFR